MENASTFAIPPAFSQKTVGIALEVWYNMHRKGGNP
jgi:hypothetical protein